VKRRHRRCLYAVLLIGGLCLTTGQAQYVEDSVDCGATAVGSLCYNSRAGVIYGTSEYGPFFAISAATNEIVSSTRFDYPVWVVYDSIDNKAYCIVSTADYDTIMVMDGTTHERIGAIPLEWGTRAVWNPDNDRLYVTMDEMNRVAVIDCKADTVITEIPVGSGAVGAVLNRRHQKLYVQNWDSNDISIIDLVTNQVIKTLGVGDSPEAGCYSYAADKYYCNGAVGVAVVDGASDTLLRGVSMPWSPRAMVANDVHGRVMVAAHDSILVIDAGRDSIVWRLAVGRQPQGLVWSAATDQVYCANYSGSVSVITGDGARVVATLPVGPAPFCLAVAPLFHRVDVGCLNSRWVYVVRDTASGVQEPPTPGPAASILRVQPNPFSKSVSITCSSTARGGDVARVYALDGTLVAEVQVPTGGTRCVWDGRDPVGVAVPAGVYVMKTTSGRYFKVVKAE